MEEWKVFLKTQRTVWEVSTWGNIKKNGKPYSTFEKGGKPNNRYKCISLNNPYCGYVHSIVAHTFIPNPEGWNTVDHIDGNKKNNHVDNLRWASAKLQFSAAADLGLLKRTCRTWDGVTPYAEYMHDREQNHKRLYEEGNSIKKIMQITGNCYNVIRNDLNRIGVPIRITNSKIKTYK